MVSEDQSSNETATRILDTVEAIINEVGEQNLRVTDVAERCGVAVGLLYHYYKDRSALISAVRLRQFTRSVETDIDSLDALLSTGAPAQDVYDALVAAIGEVASAQRQANRRARLAVIAATQHDAELRKQIAETQSRLNERVVRLVSNYQNNSLVDPNLDAKSLALFVQAIALGMTIIDINSDDAPDPKGWEELTKRILASLTPPSSAA